MGAVARAMTSPHDGAAGAAAGEPTELPAAAASWRTWHSDSDLSLRRNVIHDMCVPFPSLARDAAPARARGGGSGAAYGPSRLRPICASAPWSMKAWTGV